jgi:hypothetical protein
MTRHRKERPSEEQPVRKGLEEPAERSSAPRDDEPAPPQIGEDPGTLDEADRS